MLGRQEHFCQECNKLGKTFHSLSVPVKDHTYTLEQIERMTLPDSPFLQFYWKNTGLQVIQTSHITKQQCLIARSSYTKRMLFKDTLWRFVMITNEEIPIFIYQPDCDRIEDWVTIEEFKDDFGKRDFWVCLKDYPRQNPQFIQLNLNLR